MVPVDREGAHSLTVFSGRSLRERASKNMSTHNPLLAATGGLTPVPQRTERRPAGMPKPGGNAALFSPRRASDPVISQTPSAALAQSDDNHIHVCVRCPSLAPSSRPLVLASELGFD